MEIILTHPNADFDAVASLLGAHKLYPQAVPVLPKRLNRNVKEFITLYQNGLPFVPWDDFSGRHLERVVLVDTQRVPQIKALEPETPVLIIDHHPVEQEHPTHVTMTGEVIGATATLLVEQLRERDIPLNSLEATLLALGIYEDTGAMTYGGTTPRDIQAAAWLVRQKAVLDTVRRFLAPILNDEQQALYELMVRKLETRDIEGYTVMVGAVTLDHRVRQINSVAHRLRDTLEPDGLILLVEMLDHVQMVCRSTTDAIDVGEVASSFGGGGHTRAAAANIKDRPLNELVAETWTRLAEIVQPVVRVADLMSYGVQTVAVDVKLSEIITKLRRIGHEGYPVLDDENSVVGLLTLRSADRALEHGLKHATVREVMDGGTTTLTPDDSVSELENLMVDSGWGQIPVVNDAGKLIGIVTRTDLIKHWVRSHPQAPTPRTQIDPGEIARVLGADAAVLIDAVAQQAAERHLNTYMVGGVVRDLLVSRPNYDIDFVVEGDGIDLAEDLNALYGGEVNSFRPFGTAKWLLDEATATALNIDHANIPHHIDFATSRNEFYEHPTALPSVYSGSIKLDLHRRDFTINTLAIQLSPETAAYRLLDFYGGLNDLRAGIIRVLHSLSFVDDPTRILRAVRFEQRLGFEIEPRTAELIATSGEMLARITGERVRNELTLLLKENKPEQGLLELERRGVLRDIHPALTFSETAAARFEWARAERGMWPVEHNAIEDVYWHLWLAHLPPDDVVQVAERLMFGKTATESLRLAAVLVHEPGLLHEPDAAPSAITRQLDEVPEVALLAAWAAGTAQERIRTYLQTWRDVQPQADGHTLREMGLPPGPAYRHILERLRAARLDGEIDSDDDEHHLLEQLVQEARS